MNTDSNRRDFLTGRSALQAVQRKACELVDSGSNIPSRGTCLLLRTVAMACDFDVILNRLGPDQQLAAASTALERVVELEQVMSFYRDDSLLTKLVRLASSAEAEIAVELAPVLKLAFELSAATDGAFDPTNGALTRLWKACRKEGRLPAEGELLEAKLVSGWQRVQYNAAAQTLQIPLGMLFDLGAIGKGFAVDQAVEILKPVVSNALIHGGKSSIFAMGVHEDQDGWPIEIQNPQLPDRPFLTVMLKDAALGTSGVAVQGYRVGDRRYGHIIDPRTGWPAERFVSVSVIAPSAALADALSTAFFVMGTDEAIETCQKFPGVGAVLFPTPSQGFTLEPVLIGISSDRIYWHQPTSFISCP